MAVDPVSLDDKQPGGSRHGQAGPDPRLMGRAAAASPETAPLLAPGDPGDDEDELSLREIWAVLRRHRWVVLGCAAFVTVIALISTLLETPLYRSTATVQLIAEPLRIVQVEGIETTGYDWEFIGTQLELLMSRATAQRAVRQLGLVGDDAFEASLTKKSGLGSLLALLRGGGGQEPSTVSLDEREEQIVNYVMGNREVRQRRESKIVEVSFISPDPVTAARVANGLAEAFRAADLARKQDNSDYARNFLQDQLQQLKQKLEDSERAVIEFAQRQRLASVDQNAALATANLEQLNNVLGQATAERIRTESRWRQVETSGPAALDTGDNQVLDTLRESRADLRAEYESMRSMFKPDYPGLQQLSRRIAEVEARIAEETSAYAKVIKAEYDAALANEKLLREQLNALQAELLDLQGRSVEFNILKREADTNRQLYDGLLQRFKEIGVAGSVNPGSVALVDAARDGARFKPNVQRSGLIGLLLGLLAGVALAFVMERLDDTLKSPEDIERHLRVPVIGVVPRVNEDLVASLAEDPRSGFSEAYRSLRTGLQFAGEEGAPRTLLVTSTMQGEGKSTTAVMLARKFAQLGLRVLLVDGDMRKPSLHSRMNLPTVPGLAEYLSGAADGAVVFKASALDNVTVVTAGQQPSNPAELLAAPAFRTLLAKASADYDQVIVDGPPLLGLADVPIMANVADGTLLVVEAGRARVGAVRDALKRLIGARARVVGTVLEKYDPQAANSGYGYSGYYQYADAVGGERRKRWRFGKS